MSYNTCTVKTVHTKPLADCRISFDSQWTQKFFLQFKVSSKNLDPHSIFYLFTWHSYDRFLCKYIQGTYNKTLFSCP